MGFFTEIKLLSMPAAAQMPMVLIMMMVIMFDAINDFNNFETSTHAKNPSELWMD